MVAAFGSGAMFSLVSGMGGPNQATNVITSGLFFALIQGGIFQCCFPGWGKLWIYDPSPKNCVLSKLGTLGSPIPDMNVALLVMISKKVSQFLLIGQKFSQPPAEDLFYSRTRSMLTSLGLQNYEKNFKRGFALKDARIPPGPRLLILDHIQRAEKCKAAVAGCRGVELVELPTNKLTFDEWGNACVHHKML
ncbi:hypothetical protein CK203_049316 [Vitis vinifera]|uniref:Uncharacterized protein n=1 Tax=Vitis vinifera TaxID=29760 RepID=A0A438FLR5_VITVI|nr:hypothetical protein CK203_049316 [Vitis vinifera]